MNVNGRQGHRDREEILSRLETQKEPRLRAGSQVPGIMSPNQESDAQMAETPRCPAISTCPEFRRKRSQVLRPGAQGLPENWPFFPSPPLQDFFLRRSLWRKHSTSRRKCR